MSSLHQTHWVFGYGSLIWNPGFTFLQSQRAVLHGAHRRLCILSHMHRGTLETPGLVFGLEQGGACAGMAFEIEPAAWIEVRDYLREREQQTMVYREVYRNLTLHDGRKVSALAYLADPTHPQYAGRLPLETQLEIVRKASGNSGPNSDYVLNTAQYLRQIGINDKPVNALANLLTSAP